jgi:ERF superfamily
VSESTTLRRKLFLAGKAAQAVEKNGHSEDGGFDFTRFNDVLAEASRVLEEQGIVIVPEVDDVQLRFAKSGDGALAIVSMTFEVCDSETEETITKKWSGTGWDDKPGDKALYTAITGSEKYFLAKLLNIPFGIDPEEDSAPSAEAQRIAEEQDRAAEQPDLRPVPDPVPAGDLEDDLPAADEAGL